MTAANEAIESGIEIADVNAVVKTVSAGRNQLEPSFPNCAGLHHGDRFESHQRRHLNKFVDTCRIGGEDRYGEDPIDGMGTEGVLHQQAVLELATPYHQAVVAEPPCVGTDEPLLHCESGMATGGPSLVGVRRTG